MVEEPSMDPEFTKEEIEKINRELDLSVEDTSEFPPFKEEVFRGKEERK